MSRSPDSVTYNQRGELAKSALRVAQRLVRARLEGRGAYERELGRALVPRHRDVGQLVWLVALADALTLVSATATTYVSVRLEIEPSEVLECVGLADDVLINAPPHLELVDGGEATPPAA